jgi:hypothetical protein
MWSCMIAERDLSHAEALAHVLQLASKAGAALSG